MTSVTLQTQQISVAHDPWDAPYFGAPVYLAYPDFTARGAEAAPEQSHVAASAPATEERRLGETVAPVAAASGSGAVVASAPAEPSVVTRRQGWLARLFGGR